MLLKKKTRKKAKIVKEIVETRFKEIKPDEKEIKDESSLEKDIEKSSEFNNSESFNPSGARNAPILESSNNTQDANLEQQLENTTARNTNTGEPAGSLYAAQNPGETNYGTGRYVSRDYETQERKIKVDDIMRPAGLLEEPLNTLVSPAPRAIPVQENQAEWQRQGQAREIMPQRSEYEPIDEAFRKKLPFERKRRIG